ncbi:NB-ARC domains-containing protein [Tanacetum coccineum]
MKGNRSEDWGKDHALSLLFKRKGIRAFKEDDHVRRGEERSPQVFRAIEQSRFLVVILSDGFASSPSCLRELVKIIENNEKLQEKYQIIIVYHTCKPEMVVKQTENYEATFGKHEKLVNRDVSKWKEALIKAVSLPGWDLQRLANGYESKFIDMISKHIFNELNVGSLHVGSHDWYICGVGGIGKTSIAKAVYNRIYAHFEVCSFCEDVNEFVTQFGMVQLQRQIIEDMTKEDLKISSVGEGSNALKKIMLSKKVLLILDDVREQDHLEALAGSHGWFGSGSLILITGKDRQLLIAHGVEKVYDVELLHDDEAMEVFNLYAFNHKQRKDDFRELSEQLVPYMKGHPLALKVLGCFFLGKTVCEWESELRILERYPTNDIQMLISGFSLNKKRKDSLRKALEALGSLWEPSFIYVCFVVMFNIFVYCLTKWYQSQKMRIKDYLYQNKLHEPLSETKPVGIKHEDWAQLDRQALGVVRLSLAKNVAFNILNEKTTLGLLKSLSNMYEKPSVSKKVFLIKQLVNTKMTEGATVADHMNAFNSVISKLLSVDIKFDDEMQSLLFCCLRYLIVGPTPLQYLCEAAKGAVNVSMDAFDDALLCCIEKYHESWVMDLGASLHATPCVGMMKNFKPLLGKVRLADRKKMRIKDYLYQNKLHEPFSETKPVGIKHEDWAQLDRQALGVVRLSLAKNVAFNILNEKTTLGLLKSLSNMYEKPSVSKKVFLIKQLVNMKMTEGATVADHVNAFNSVISKLLSVDIKFDDEMQSLYIVSRSCSWSDTVTGSTSGTNKLTFEGHIKSQCEAAKGAVNVSMDAFDNALLCCIEEYHESWVMDSGASLHATPCVGMMKNFKPLLGKVRLADRKVLDVTGIGDVILKTTFGTK